MKITAENLPLLREELLAALKPVCEKHGLRVAFGRGSYEVEKNVVWKLEVSQPREDGLVMSKDATAFQVYCFRWGMQKTDLGRPLIIQGRQMTLVGARPRSTKYPIILEDAEGKIYYYPDDYILMKLKETATPAV